MPSCSGLRKAGITTTPSNGQVYVSLDMRRQEVCDDLTVDSPVDLQGNAYRTNRCRTVHQPRVLWENKFRSQFFVNLYGYEEVCSPHFVATRGAS